MGQERELGGVYGSGSRVRRSIWVRVEDPVKCTSQGQMGS